MDCLFKAVLVYCSVIQADLTCQEFLGWLYDSN